MTHRALNRGKVLRRNPYIMEVKLSEMVKRMRHSRRIFKCRGFIHGIPIMFCEHQGRISLWPRP